ncbi:MAG: type I methionyl aminopeptidase [Pseudomonadota bacterium]
MAVTIKTPEQQEKMRVAGRLAASVLDMIGDYVKPGVTTGELDRICHEFIVDELGAVPAPLNYKGFPKSICTSVNHVVCHGIPGDKRLRNQDIVNIDTTIIKDGFHGDTSRMYHVGKRTVIGQRLTRIAHEAMCKGIETIRPGTTLGDIGHTIQSYVEDHGYSVVREYCGHGIGESFHEDPHVLHVGKPGDGLALREGMTLTVEPMVNAGRAAVKPPLRDGWTVVTKDHSLSAQWEHTVLVTADGYEVLTLGASGEM